MFKKLILLVVLVLMSLPLFAQQVDTVWIRRYDGFAHTSDNASDLVVDNAGNIYVTGSCDYSYQTIKYYPSGDTAWVRRYREQEYNIDYDGAAAIDIDITGNIYVTGTCRGDTVTGDDFVTIKYHPNGDTAWVRIYNGPENSGDGGTDITIDNTDDVYVTGYSCRALYPNCDYVTIKYYPNGDTAWVRIYNAPVNLEDLPAGIAIDGSGNVYVTGSSEQSTHYPYDNEYVTIRYYPNGDTAWIRKYNRPYNSDNRAYALAVDDSGDVYVTGKSLASSTSYDYATIKYYPNGDTAWVRRYAGEGNTEQSAFATAVDSIHNVYVTGASYNYGTGSVDYATIKYHPNGDTAWVRTYNGPSGGTDVARKIAVDRFGNVYVSGESRGDYATVKYDSNGNEIWSKRYNGPANSSDLVAALVVDGNGNVYVTGTSDGIDTYQDWATIKYCQSYSPYSFSLLSPTDSILVPYFVIFNWETATDPDSSDQVLYDLHLSSSSSFHPDSSIIYYDLLSCEFVDTLNIGRYYWKVRANHNCIRKWSNQTWTFLSAKRGDVNADKKITVTDVVYLVNFLFRGGNTPIPESLVGDVNCDSKLTVSDVVYVINYLFRGGPAPCS